MVLIFQRLKQRKLVREFMSYFKLARKSLDWTQLETLAWEAFQDKRRFLFKCPRWSIILSLSKYREATISRNQNYRD